MKAFEDNFAVARFDRQNQIPHERDGTGKGLVHLRRVRQHPDVIADADYVRRCLDSRTGPLPEAAGVQPMCCSGKND